jgi:NAD(P)H-dependent flavin oxidoreductase YrpB (nitropropane dioxygenase family)
MERTNKMPEFILMLTRNDQTVADARGLYAQLADSGVTHVGFKDVGLPADELEGLIADIRANGHTAHIEVVAETPEATLASAEMARQLTPDYLLGGTLIEPVMEVISGTDIKFFPYVGRVVGHPCLLQGSIEEIVEDAKRVESLGVDGINLLAYRYSGDVLAMVEAVVDNTELPVVCAGSIASEAQIRDLARLGIWGFTIGGAVLDRQVAEGAPLATQVETALAAAA